MSKPKLLWFSNSPYLGTGYGQQTALFAPMAERDGFDVRIVANAGHQGAVFKFEGVEVMPKVGNAYSTDILQPHRAYFAPDVTVSLFDAWVFEPGELAGVTAWAPVDHDPIPPLVADRLRHAEAAWAMSRHGQRMMRQAGVEATYVPHGINAAQFYPDPAVRAKERERMGLRPGQFLALMVSANKGVPSRKAFPEAFKAWALFIQAVPDAVLYVHTLMTDGWGGLDLVALAKFYGIPPANLRFADPYPLLNGFFREEHLNAAYNAADVLLMPSMGEGFGVPAVEAQAAGCPVIVTDFTAQAELCGVGYRVPVDPDDLIYTAQGSHQARARPSAIVEALYCAYQQRNDPQQRQQGVDFARQYSHEQVWRRYMKPALLEQIEKDAARERRRAKRKALDIPATPALPGTGVALVFMCQDNAHWLKLHLPVWAEAGLPMLALDGGSTDDTVAYLESQGVTVAHRPFAHDFAAQANALLDAARAAGYEAVIRLDPDELMFPDAIRRLAEALIASWSPDALSVNRANFAGDRTRYQPQHWPDPQVRAMRLAKVHYRNAVHEVVVADDYGHASEVIYHYGMIEPLKLRSLKFYNYLRIASGQPVVASYEDVPEEARLKEYPPTEPYTKLQPLDPYVIGVCAPFEAEARHAELA